MQDFRKPKNRARRVLGVVLRSVAALALLALAVVSVRAAFGMYQTFTGALASEEETKKELAALKHQEAQVGASVEGLSTERGLESQVRARYGWGRPGEGKIDVVRDPEPSADGAGAGGDNAIIRFFKSLMGL
ncbi:hypothetical protein A3D68_01010 [Candidatus Adlerbacteria bacterium RIFCSPHIGHO2_02_FULL_52_17]|uniref:Cell division protein FtsL n=1 Tax=Candidatus Adlerbacteria bacterium RIFCSPHIGHO2_02_FULL_52_17 TaxID=1797240 RepID=A0A1F4XNM2_9BACT|nr:MAG: hypothetical protein A3D68_01010 [Candidatus Adlerbacteria bacterium RIFCSPHIGHO2_02_FULL_52_17]